MVKALELEGKVYGLLKVTKRLSNTKQGKSAWECVCSCGEITRAAASKLVSGDKTSCGCLTRKKLKDMKAKTEKERKTRNSWRGMKARCDDVNNARYESYGGVGIGYPSEWKSFQKFLEDLGYREEGKTLDRIDNSLGYSKGNCRWAEASIQQYNKHPTGVNKTTGVRRSVNGKAWVAQIGKDSKNIYLGTFKDYESAVAKRVESEKELYGYSKTKTVG